MHLRNQVNSNPSPFLQYKENEIKPEELATLRVLGEGALASACMKLSSCPLCRQQIYSKTRVLYCPSISPNKHACHE